MSGQPAEEGSVASDLRVLLESAEGADVWLQVGESQLRAHSLVLAARSPKFAAALSHAAREGHERRIEVTDLREDVLRQLLLFVYSDQTPELASLAPELLAAADRYHLPLLKKRCEQQMARDLGVEGAADTARLAVLHSCPGLKDSAVEFIAGHPEVMASDGWARLLRDNKVAVDICRQLALWTPPQPVTETASDGTQESKRRVICEELKEDLARRLTEASRDGRLREVWALLAAGAPQDARDDEGQTALHLAAAHGHADTVQCLLGAGLDANATDPRGQTPLHKAAEGRDADVVWMLVAASADVNAGDMEGRTPLHFAAWWSGLGAITALCAEGTLSADPAPEAGVMRVLVLAGARADVQDMFGRTPAFVATNPISSLFTADVFRP